MSLVEWSFNWTVREVRNLPRDRARRRLKLHLLGQIFARLGIHHIEVLLVDEHCLQRLPITPCFFETESKMA